MNVEIMEGKEIGGVNVRNEKNERILDPLRDGQIERSLLWKLYDHSKEKTEASRPGARADSETPGPVKRGECVLLIRRKHCLMLKR